MTQRLTRERYRRWAEGQGRRYELVAGEPVAMSPEQVAHVRLKNRVWAALDRAIRAANLPCEALGDSVTVEVDDDTDYEPDVVVNCGPPLHPDAIAANNPVIVVEVMSPSTQSIDVPEKLADYFRVPSVQHYLIVRARRHEVIHHRRAGAEIITRVINVGALTFDPPGVSVEIDDFYAGSN
jgi:Uma2 family endonuclease